MGYPSNVTFAFQVQTGVYLSVIGRDNGLMCLEAAKSSIDGWSRFSMEPLNATQVALKAANGMYLSVIYRDGRSPIEASKGSIDPPSTFTVDSRDGNTITLRAWNNMYLSMIGRDGGQNPIEAAKSNVDEWCRFLVTTLTV